MSWRGSPVAEELVQVNGSTGVHARAVAANVGAWRPGAVGEMHRMYPIVLVYGEHRGGDQEVAHGGSVASNLEVNPAVPVVVLRKHRTRVEATFELEYAPAGERVATGEVDERAAIGRRPFHGEVVDRLHRSAPVMR